MKVVINTCFGGFRLSDEAYEWLIENKGWKSSPVENEKIVDESTELYHEDDSYYGKYNLNKYLVYSSQFRSNLDVIAVVEELGDRANGKSSNLKVIEIPDDIQFVIYEHAGVESIHEVHRAWS